MIPSDTTDLIVAQSTHAGETGKNNEDRAVVGAFRAGAAAAGAVTLAMVADGIGGHAAGEIASDLAVRNVYDHLAQGDARDPLGSLQAALLTANQAIYERSRSEPQLQGMGSTAVVALIVGRRLYAAHVGDSRMYLIHGGSIQQLTIDHTWVQEAISAGLLSRADLSYLRGQGVVGEICGRFYDIDGHYEGFEINNRIISLDLDDLRQIPQSVAVARGPLKAEAIVGALRGKFVKVLATDDVTARTVLRLASDNGRQPLAAHQ